MRIGGCTFSFGPRPLREAAEILKKFGFERVDLGVCIGNGQIDPFLASEEPDRTASEAIRILDELEMTPDECFVRDFGLPINHLDEAVRSNTRRSFPGLARFAAKVGCRSIMLTTGFVHETLGRERSFDLSAQELCELVRISTGEGVFLNVEPSEPSVVQNPNDTIRLCEQVPGLGLTLDYSHFIDPGFDQAAVEPLHRFARHFHVRQAARGKRVETVEKGTIDFARIVSLLTQERFKGVLAVEYVDCAVTTRCGVDVLVETPKMKAKLEGILGIA